MKNEDTLTITKQQVLDAAAKHKVNVGLLKDLFPSAFSNFKPLKPGDRFKYDGKEWMVCKEVCNFQVFYVSLKDGSCEVYPKKKSHFGKNIETEAEFEEWFGVPWTDDMAIK